MKREILIFVFLFIILLFFPWWVTYTFAVVSLGFSKGYAGLVSAIFLDVLYIPASLPYASGIFLILLFAAYLLKKRMLINSMEL